MTMTKTDFGAKMGRDKRFGENLSDHLCTLSRLGSAGIVQPHAFVATVLNFRLAVAFETHISFPDSFRESVRLIPRMRYN